MSVAGALRAHRTEESSTRRIGILFMVGSACFALASLPGSSSVSAELVGVTYFVGSIFFTSAAFEQLRTSRGRAERWSSAIQFAGTLLFNVNTFDAMLKAGDEHPNLLVWLPDAIGSICFLVSSAIATAVVFRLPFMAVAHRIARLNLVGSIFFGISAVAGIWVAQTSAELDASLARSGTLVGALCFFYASYLLVARDPAADTAEAAVT